MKLKATIEIELEAGGPEYSLRAALIRRRSELGNTVRYGRVHLNV